MIMKPCGTMTNLNSKRLGDDLSLDEYNACQYLLYHMTCWTDSTTLNNYRAKKGKFATYKFSSKGTFNSLLKVEKHNNYRILEEMTSSNCIFYINLSKITKHFSELHISASVTLFTKNAEKLDTGTETDKGFSSLETKEIPMWSKDEAIKAFDMEDYVPIVFEDCYDEDNDRFELSFIDSNGKKLLNKGDVFNKYVYIEYKFTKKPYIDFRNGTANQNEEIWVESVSELSRLVANAPNNGELTVFRLDSNKIFTKPKGADHLVSELKNAGVYYLKEPLIIQNGQNVSIRGGTNPDCYGVLNASLSDRCIIIKPGGKLSLNHICCEFGNAKKSPYDTGRGGAILVECDNNGNFGILECQNCYFHRNQASHGGAIFSYHAGLHINKCEFFKNLCLYNGGAIHYKAIDAVMKMKNIVTKPNTAVTINCTLESINGGGLNEGKVSFYIRKNGQDTLINTCLVENGKAEVTYRVPSEVTTVEYPIIAKYTGGVGIDDDVAQCTLRVKVPVKYTASWASGNVVTGKEGENIRLNAKVQDSAGRISTEPTMMFKIGSKTYGAAKNGNIYTLVYPLNKADITNTKDNSYTVEFAPVSSVEYTCNTISAKITINVEKESNAVEGYLTGLYVNSGTAITDTMINRWADNGITDVYVRFANYENESLRQNLEIASAKRTLFTQKKIRVHAALNVLQDIGNKKTFLPTDTSRVDWIKKEIDYIASNYDIDGINLDYMRYAGTGGADHTKITSLYKTLQTYIKSKNKNYIISTSTKAEDASSKTVYGQDNAEIVKYVDYIQPMIYKGDYNKTDDSWVVGRLDYILNLGVDKSKIMVALQTYNHNYITYSYESMNATAKALVSKEIKGVALFREGYNPTSGNKTYMKPYKDIVGGN